MEVLTGDSSMVYRIPCLILIFILFTGCNSQVTDHGLVLVVHSKKVFKPSLQSNDDYAVYLLNTSSNTYTIHAEDIRLEQRLTVRMLPVNAKLSKDQIFMAGTIPFFDIEEELVELLPGHYYLLMQYDFLLNFPVGFYYDEHPLPLRCKLVAELEDFPIRLKGQKSPFTITLYGEAYPFYFGTKEDSKTSDN